jgi:hypothetical protein
VVPGTKEATLTDIGLDTWGYGPDEIQRKKNYSDPSLDATKTLGNQTNPQITAPYTSRQIGRRYKDAIEAGISEDSLVLDVKWMLDTAKQQEDVGAVLRVWRFLMEYTVGKPEKAQPRDGDMQGAIINALKAGAEFMIDLQPEDTDEQDKESGNVPDTDGPLGDEADREAAGDSPLVVPRPE